MKNQLGGLLSVQHAESLAIAAAGIHRPPGTVVMFADVFFSARDLRAPSADRRETLPSVLYFII